MSQWKNTSDSANAVAWVATSLQQGSGPANVAANNTALVVNTTPGAILSHGNKQNIVVGQFPITSWTKANTSGESGLVHGTGWALRREYEGPILTLSVANGSFVNGETATISGGSVNAIASLTTNATGNLVSGVITTLGLFPNVSVTSVAFTRELHNANLHVTGTDANLGDANVINIVLSANTLDAISYGLNAVAVVVSNTGGTLTNTQTQAIVWSGNSTPTANATGFWGLFSNATTNTSLIATITNANGSPITGLTLTANLTPSVGGNVHVLTLGGRAGRVTYEMLVAMAPYSLANGTQSNTTQLPSYVPTYPILGF